MFCGNSSELSAFHACSHTPQPCHQYAQRSQQARFRIKKPVHLTMHTPHYQKRLSLLHSPAAGRTTFHTTEQWVHRTPQEAAVAFSKGGDRPMLAAAIVTLWKHTALWSLTAVKAIGITPPICKNKLSSQIAAQTLQKLDQPTHPHDQREKPTSCFVTQQPLSSSCFPSSSSSVSVLIWATPSR